MTLHTVIDSPNDFPAFNWRWWEWALMYGIVVVTFVVFVVVYR